MDEPLNGRCLCGAVRLRIRGRASLPIVCHCRYCQRRLGTAFAEIAYFRDSAIESIEGELVDYEHRSDESGRRLVTRFCPRCGTTVLTLVEALPGLSGVSLGVLDEPERVPIRRHVWVRSKRDWVTPPDDAVVHDRMPKRPDPG